MLTCPEMFFSRKRTPRYHITLTLILALRMADLRTSICALLWYSSAISTALEKVWLRWSTSWAKRTLLWESILAWILPSRINFINSFSRLMTEVLKLLAILLRSAELYGEKSH